MFAKQLNSNMIFIFGSLLPNLEFIIFILNKVTQTPVLICYFFLFGNPSLLAVYNLQ